MPTDSEHKRYSILLPSWKRNGIQQKFNQPMFSTLVTHIIPLFSLGPWAPDRGCMLTALSPSQSIVAVRMAVGETSLHLTLDGTDFGDGVIILFGYSATLHYGNIQWEVEEWIVFHTAHATGQTANFTLKYKWQLTSESTAHRLLCKWRYNSLLKPNYKQNPKGVAKDTIVVTRLLKLYICRGR